MKALITFYRSRLHLLSEGDHWCLALRNCYLEEPVSEVLIASLLEEGRPPSIDHPRDYLFYLRRLVSLAFIVRLNPIPPLLSSVKEKLQHIYSRGFWRELQLGEALYALGCYLVNLPFPSLKPKQLEKGGVLLEAGNHLLDGGVAHPVLNAELALVWFFLGWEMGDKNLLRASLEWVHIVMDLFDHENRPFHGIWLRESDYHPLTFFTHYFLLFSVSSEALPGSKTQYLADALFAELKKVQGDPLPKGASFLALLAHGFGRLYRRKKSFGVDGQFALSRAHESLGCMVMQRRGMSLACTFSGVNTGLGALHKTHVRIISFGPHFAPLADTNCYGLHRSIADISNPFRDLEFKREGENFEIRGWTRLISPLISPTYRYNMTLNWPGGQWLFFSASGDGEKLIFESRLSERDETSPLYFAYFISADRANIEGERPFLPATLNQYEGISRPIAFKKGGEELRVYSKTETEMRLIPLAGGRHFWAADFLLAFLFKEGLKVYSWEIS